MAGYLMFSKKVVAISVVVWLGMGLCVYGQQKKPITDPGKSPVPSVQAPRTIPKAALVKTPDLIGKTKGSAELVLKQNGLKMGRIRNTPIGKGKPGMVVKQHPGALTPVARGNAVDLWIMTKAGIGLQKYGPSAQAQPQPRFYARRKQLFMELPETVHKVVVFDDKGKVLQQFNRGRRFDITESLIKTNGGSIYLGIAPDPGSAVPMRWDPRDRAPYDLARYRNLARGWIVREDETSMGRSEPANNSIGGAPLLSAGVVEGAVGGDDAEDFGKVTVSGDGTGTLVQVEVISGSVQLDLYDPTQRSVDGGASKIWIALAPSTTFYFRVSPNGFTATDYRIRISKNRLNDVYETNDSFPQAKTFGAGQAFLGNVINSSGAHLGFNDFYKVRIAEPKNVRIAVANIGLASGKRVTIALYDATNTLVTSEYDDGSADGCVLEYDLRPDWAGVDYPPFPNGDWRILISEQASNTSGVGSPSAYGLGDPPAAYTRASGYSMTTTLTP